MIINCYTKINGIKIIDTIHLEIFNFLTIV